MVPLPSSLMSSAPLEQSIPNVSRRLVHLREFASRR
jgi:hypothetical protein